MNEALLQLHLAWLRVRLTIALAITPEWLREVTLEAWRDHSELVKSRHEREALGLER